MAYNIATAAKTAVARRCAESVDGSSLGSRSPTSPPKGLEATGAPVAGLIVGAAVVDGAAVVGRLVGAAVSVGLADRKRKSRPRRPLPMYHQHPHP